MRLHNPVCLVFSGLCNQNKDRYLLDEKSSSRAQKHTINIQNQENELR